MDRNWDMDALAKSLWGEEDDDTDGGGPGGGGGGGGSGGGGGLRPFSDADPGKGGFISPDAQMSGQVALGEGTCVYPEVHIRAGDGGKIVLGEKCVVLDGAVIKASPGKTCDIGDGSMVSYNAVVIDAEVGDGCLVGRDSVVLPGSRLADGTVLNDGTVVPPGGGSDRAVLLKGYPAEAVRDIIEDEVIKMLEVNQRLREGAREYCLHAAMKRL